MSSSAIPQIASSTEIGGLGVCHLKRLWSASLAARMGAVLHRDGEAHLDRLVLDALGLGLQQTMKFLHLNAPSLRAFEQWVIGTAGAPDPARVARLNADICGHDHPDLVRHWLNAMESAEPALTREDLGFWAENGYVVLRNAVPSLSREAGERAVWNQVGADPLNPDSWYGSSIQGIMVELIQHPALEANRRAPRIHKAFSQLWGTVDLWVSADRCGFHPPQRAGYPFPGPDLHWDIDLRQPAAFGTQGILYLTDTPPDQGALTLVPGFQKRLPEWLRGLQPGADPHNEDLHALGSVPVGGRAGDMIIWHQSLPHGSRPNLGKRPRIVQYINLYPGRPGA